MKTLKFESQLRLYDVLQNENVTNRELAHRVGISEQQIGKYVNYKAYPSLPRLHDIADALGLRVKDLFAPIG